MKHATVAEPPDFEAANVPKNAGGYYTANVHPCYLGDLIGVEEWLYAGGEPPPQGMDADGAVWIGVLYGAYVFQSITVGMETLTDEEVALLEAATTGTEWNDACSKVKRARGGVYPNDWYERVIQSGMAARVLKRFGETTDIKVTTVAELK